MGRGVADGHHCRAARNRPRRSASKKLSRARRRNPSRRSRQSHRAERLPAQGFRRAQALEKTCSLESWIRSGAPSQVADDFGASSNARVRIGADDKVELSIGATDVGGGTGTSLGQIAAEQLDIPLNEIEV